ncbi:cbb3-type cytochrome oxidase assembly protein CcoS [Ancylobacter sp. MQZ15Z-1]|uniref:Cbb3-type cytochrome oxidase assembly protein CcoS n=1 Tax=Ancylobacter mangrovi TaxID=2972472 RepID=A0A9X2PK17_9HYPH|nr:cbb3-type cytochrome oxidase assembly protein CcoS [Ancylobacter mangrovi]MCS0495418.1 cbb3-type cytochrome oxidase assembly protein CcoS [Ancylobacter mangrovi]
MTVLLYLVPAALSLGLLGLAAFMWSLRTGQYDDLDGAAVRVLSDDDLHDDDARDPRPHGAGRR